ncbi:hypothetical protein BDD43_2809 [Mucilaginibacter gracilis]|uniref:DUF7336 domain-containing protein n=1 Tax=Mucilaginibacter gracilis TaxID=423350 RepID=A0A495J2Q2_9SPHI|nr:hypothetical protein [Mucilaginibacter gracilis]RKR82624.1 hypothetical protein BDD43_2809 [Mucilaginibacter gracilis]
MNAVYSLYHIHIDPDLPGGEDVKLIGIYTSIEKAKDAQRRSEMLNGFKDFKDGFEISQNILDKDEWTSGFITEAN